MHTLALFNLRFYLNWLANLDNPKTAKKLSKLAGSFGSFLFYISCVTYILCCDETKWVRHEHYPNTFLFVEILKQKLCWNREAKQL